VCRFRVAAGKAKHWTRRPINCEASKHHLLEYWLFPGLTNLGFLLREKLAAIFIIPSSWGSQLDGDLHHHHHSNQDSFWRRCRGKRRLLQGEFHTHILYFVLSFALLYFYLLHFIKNTKKLVSFIVVTLLLLVHYVVP
jgi:hypothetical protein